MSVYIYLAGPITGCNDEGANSWRDDFATRLFQTHPHFVGVSPLRCEPIIGDIYKPQYDDNQFGTPEVIGAKNKMDVARCDLTMAYLPADNPPSIGTLQEIGWAAGMGKPIILVTDNGYVRNNAVIKATVPWRFPERPHGFQKALEVIEGLYLVYNS